MADTLSSRRWYYLQLIVAALGAGTSLYLLVQHTRLKTGIQGSSLCNLGTYADCNVVNASTHAEIAGVPLASLGVLYFALLLMLGILQQPSSRGFRQAQVHMARFSLFALAVDVWLLGVQAFSLHSFCLFCMLTYVCTLLHLGANWIQLPADHRSWKSLIRGERKARLAPMAIAGTVMVLIGVAVAQFQYVFTTFGEAHIAGLEQSKKVFLDTWDSRPAKTIPIRPGDPVWGNRQARVSIVVFSDFECPHCQRAAFALHTALAPVEAQVSLVFKNFPLDMACNPLLNHALHANACALANLGYCANQKKKFWEYHDRVFFKLSARELSSTQDAIHEGVKNLFTKAEFDACLKDPAAAANTREDLELGKTLEIDSTPTIFINGKRVAFAPTVDLIRELVDREIAKP